MKVTIESALNGYTLSIENSTEPSKTYVFRGIDYPTMFEYAIKMLTGDKVKVVVK